jgi:hypothetical protein
MQEMQEVCHGWARVIKQNLLQELCHAFTLARIMPPPQKVIKQPYGKKCRPQKRTAPFA